MAGITISAINSLVTEARREGKAKHLTDGTVPGLTLVVSRMGCASWRLRYYVGPKQKEIVMGRFPDLTPSGARDKANQLRMAIKDGVDVAAEKQAKKTQSNIEKRNKALSHAMLCQITDWLSTWWHVASDERRSALFKDWQQAVTDIPGASKWQG